MSKFTKGEWEEGRNGISVFDEKREMTLFITDGVYGWTTEEAQANARLIVAAPEMYELLRDLAKELRAYGDEVIEDLYSLMVAAEELTAWIDGEEYIND